MSTKLIYWPGVTRAYINDMRINMKKSSSDGFTDVMATMLLVAADVIDNHEDGEHVDFIELFKDVQEQQ